MTPADTTRSRKWIDAEIERLDPETDWALIYRLMNAYRPNDFMLDMVYAHVFPHFLVPEHAAAPVWRHGTDAKVLNRAGVRADDTSWHNMIWWHYGPGDERTKRSVATVNKIHAHYAQANPEAFLHYDDYVYVWCFSAATMHRLRVAMGLPGYTEKEKIAAHRFWKEMGALFEVPGDTSGRHPLERYPESFDALLEWMEEFEGREWPANPQSAKAAKAVLEQFLFRYFPRPVRPLMRAVVTSFYAPSVLRAFQITPPPRPVQALLRRACGVAMALGDRFGPDPTESYVVLRESRTDTERKAFARRLREQDDAFRNEFSSWLEEAGQTDPFWAGGVSGCPHLAGADHETEGVAR